MSRAKRSNFLAVLLQQLAAEQRLKARGIKFRTADPSSVLAAYTAMSTDEFDRVNARQAWANWRTISRCLNGNVPNRPLLVIDLGCGSGESTLALEHCCPPGSLIVGYEMAAQLAQVAKLRTRHCTCQVDIVCQSVEHILRLPCGAPVTDGSIDVVNASGVIGHHFTRDSIDPLVREIQRVLSPAGIAMLDVGPSLSETELVKAMEMAGFARMSRHKSCMFDRNGQVVFRRRS